MKYKIFREISIGSANILSNTVKYDGLLQSGTVINYIILKITGLLFIYLFIYLIITNKLGYTV